MRRLEDLGFQFREHSSIDLTAPRIMVMLQSIGVKK